MDSTRPDPSEPNLPEPHHTIQIGDGCQYIEDIQSWDIVIATGSSPTDLCSLHCRLSGEIRVNGRVVGSDAEVVENLRKLIYRMLKAEELERAYMTYRDRLSK